MKEAFTLINAEQIHLKPGEKVIRQEDYAELLNAEQLIALTKKDVETYKLTIAKEAEVTKEKAAEAGFQEGMNRWAEKLKELELEIEKVHKEITQLAIPVALKAAKKIVGRELEISETAVVDIVAANLKAVAHHKKIKIYVNKQDLVIMEKNKEKLKKQFETLESLLIIEHDEVKPGGAIIETEGGIINAQLDNLLQTLERAFESLTKPELKESHG